MASRAWGVGEGYNVPESEQIRWPEPPSAVPVVRREITRVWGVKVV